MPSDQPPPPPSQFLWNGQRRNTSPTRSLSPDEESLINDEVASDLDRVEQEKLESDINRAMNARKDSVQP